MPGILLSKKRSSLKHSLHATPLPQKGEGGSRSEDSDIKSFQLWEPRGLPREYASAGAGGEQPEPARRRQHGTGPRAPSAAPAPSLVMSHSAQFTEQLPSEKSANHSENSL